MDSTEMKEKLKTKIVGIVGAGGLGSNCAATLARAGIGHLIIADVDRVEAKNLDRQFYFHNQIGRDKVFALRDNLSAINPEIKITALKMNVRLCDIYEVFKVCDIVVEGLDNAASKSILIETMSKQLPKIPLIIAPCIPEIKDNLRIDIEKYENLRICGEGFYDLTHKLPMAAPRIGIVANMQAAEVIHILLM
jgi:sulfur carrier protein ThiS adenylyltransferase